VRLTYGELRAELLKHGFGGVQALQKAVNIYKHTLKAWRSAHDRFGYNSSNLKTGTFDFKPMKTPKKLQQLGGHRRPPKLFLISDALLSFSFQLFNH